MKIQAENKTHTPCYPVIAAVAAAMLALPACEAPQTLTGKVKPKVESKEVGKDQRSQQPVMGKRPPQGVVGKKPKVESKEVGKDQRSQQPVMGSVVPPTKPVRPPQRVCGRKKVAPPKQ
ncbi:MAG: hypothetical protein MJ058_01510 [Akkermansia sp.]|nr:hypothetical protein [Akkermansia sp.]